VRACGSLDLVRTAAGLAERAAATALEASRVRMSGRHSDPGVDSSSSEMNLRRPQGRVAAGARPLQPRPTGPRPCGRGCSCCATGGSKSVPPLRCRRLSGRSCAVKSTSLRPWQLPPRPRASGRHPPAVLQCPPSQHLGAVVRRNREGRQSRRGCRGPPERRGRCWAAPHPWRSSPLAVSSPAGFSAAEHRPASTPPCRGSPARAWSPAAAAVLGRHLRRRLGHCCRGPPLGKDWACSGPPNHPSAHALRGSCPNWC